MFTQNSRELTGRWYLKRRIFGFDVMVETKNTSISTEDFKVSPEYILWEKATDGDLIELKIICL